MLTWFANLFGKRKAAFQVRIPGVDSAKLIKVDGPRGAFHIHHGPIGKDRDFTSFYGDKNIQFFFRAYWDFLPAEPVINSREKITISGIGNIIGRAYGHISSSNASRAEKNLIYYFKNWSFLLGTKINSPDSGKNTEVIIEVDFEAELAKIMAAQASRKL